MGEIAREAGIVKCRLKPRRRTGASKHSPLRLLAQPPCHLPRGQETHVPTKEINALRERGDLRFSVEVKAQIRSRSAERPQTFGQMATVMVNKHKIVHISHIAPHVHALLHQTIQRAEVIQSEPLARLIAQRHTPPRRILIAVNNSCKEAQAQAIKGNTTQSPLKQFMGNTCKEMPHVNPKGPSFRAIKTKVLTQKLFQPGEREIGAFPHPASAVVIDESRLDKRGNHVVAKRMLDHAIAIVERMDLPSLGVSYHKADVRADAITPVAKRIGELDQVHAKIELKIGDFASVAFASPRQAVSLIEVPKVIDIREGRRRSGDNAGRLLTLQLRFAGGPRVPASG